MASLARHSVSLLVAWALFAWSSLAQAQSTIKAPGQRAQYFFEAEPHLLAGLLDPPGLGAGTGLGVGFRGTFEVVSEGFIPKLNDSVGIGVGIDYLRYDGWQGARGGCKRFVAAPSGVPVCVEASGSGGDVDYFYVPAVMQWNFWLHRRWSVFGEPGVALYVEDGNLEFTPFVLYLGGRFHFTDNVTLTLRVGYPTISLGVSVLL